MKAASPLTFIRVLLAHIFIAAALLASAPAFAQVKNLPDSFKVPGVDPLPGGAGGASNDVFSKALGARNGAARNGAADHTPESAPKGLLFSPLFDSLPRDIQDEIMAEASTVEKDCEADMTYSFFHDCRCLGAKFIDERVNHPDTAKQTLTFRMRKDCVNEPGIAGYSYNFCMTQFSYMMPPAEGFTDAKRDDYCKCYARTMAKRYAAAPNPTHSYINNMQITALNACLQKDNVPQQ
jgi:hypothetical protein